MSIPLNTKMVIPWVCRRCRALAIFLPPSWLAISKHTSPRACLCKLCLAWLDV